MSDTTATTPKYPGIRITSTGNHLVAQHTEARISDGGVFYPITPSTEGGELFQAAYAEGKLNVFGRPKIAIETEGEHAAQGGAIALSVAGKRVVNFTSGQGLVYGLEQYYHAPGKLSTMIVQLGARALTKHALNVHCGHDDLYAALDTGWIMLFAKDAQQAADQSLILRRVTELSLTPGINAQDGFLTTHLERTFFKHEADLIREYLGSPDDIIETPTDAQRKLFGPKRRRVPKLIDIENPVLLGPVQNQDHYMNGIVARRDNFAEPILGMLEAAYEDFARLTGRHYGAVSEYACDDAETVFVCMGSAAENIEAAIDLLRAEGDAKLGCVHVNILRPFPVAAVVRALAGKKNVIVLERTDEALSPDNPLTREVRAALSMARENDTQLCHVGVPSITVAERPRVFSGVFGLGSRDFRPEGILGAYEYVTAGGARQDGKTAADGESFFVIGIDHPYAVISARTPSLLPEKAIAVRLHSIGGWGMITTGKNLGGVIGAIADDRAHERGIYDANGHLEEVIHISSNPKYGSEKKGSPTSYFLVAAPERIRVNCDLRHVNVVLCCDPKAFTHMNPLDGMAEGGTFVWESDETPEIAWQRIPPALRANIIEKKIRLCTLPGFDIARNATDREDLQLRMQGNAFLGAFFAVSGFLGRFGIAEERFREIVHKQYDKKFGRFGSGVVESNMAVMTAGMTRVSEVPCGALDAPDLSSMRASPLSPCGTCGIESTVSCEAPAEQPARTPMVTLEMFDSEYRAGYGYHQPASALASVGVVAAAAGASSSKYVARREKPVWIPENCTQCMECITACPDTALPNTAQEIGRVLRTAAAGYVGDLVQRGLILKDLPSLEERIRARMNDGLAKKTPATFNAIVREEVESMASVSAAARSEFLEVFARIPFAYEKTPMVFGAKEGRDPGTGGVFGIFVSDLCKGCGECVAECGDKDALVMRPETEELGADHVSGIHFMNLLPDTPPEFLGRFDPENPQDSHAVTLKNHLMVRSLYEALVSGDGACAGCGEKSALRAITTLTEAYMRPIYRAKADRLRDKASQLVTGGAARMATLLERSPIEHALFRKTVLHVIMGYGGESEADTAERMAATDISDAEIVDALVQVLRQDAFNHVDLQSVDGRRADGMSVMVMGAHTGCNTVYGSTPPNNPHPYPWMNSLFQDGSTITWIFGESMIMDHARRSVIPERLATALLERDTDVIDEAGYFEFTHMSDAVMTDQEIRELPKAWAVGGDGGMGDIGFQNVSKVVLQNRPNVKMLMLDTQVYSNTGGQNSDSSLMLGGFDMNQFGSVTQGKFTEKKSLSEIFTSGHGSPFVAQVSMADVASFYKAILDGLSYRGTSFIQSFTTCQPEHGVPDDMSSTQARRVRDSRGVPQFVFNPQHGETYDEAMDLKGNPNVDLDWARVNSKARGKGALYTVAHWATTEARFRKHLKKVKSVEGLETLENAMARITQQDVIHRRFVSPSHRAHVDDFSVYIEDEDSNGRVSHYAVSRQMVLFCVERRRAWRMLQSKAGQRNMEYEAQRAVLAQNAKGEISDDELKARAAELVAEALAELKSPRVGAAAGGGAPNAPGAPGAPSAPSAPKAP